MTNYIWEVKEFVLDFVENIMGNRENAGFFSLMFHMLTNLDGMTCNAEVGHKM